MKQQITIEAMAYAPIEKIWEYWTEPQHITKWCHASSDWHAPRATNDLVVGGTFMTRMEAKNGSEGFDFGGTYTEIEQYKRIAYEMTDGRKVSIVFEERSDGYNIVETFEAEDSHTIEEQQSGWQSILNNFALYVSKNFI